MIDRGAQRAGNGLHPCDSRDVENVLGDVSMISMSAGLRRSWSDSTIKSSGIIRAWEKCRSAASNPLLAAMFFGMNIRSL